MEWTSTNELRKKFLEFYQSKNHKKLPSFSLVPVDDDSLLLINSGMAPMKKFFTGEIIPESNRVTTCQKCIRTPDIERVGITARHGTFFEMLGNFSFGDYFKEEATKWAHEFLVDVLKMPEDKLWYSIYKEDDEAYDIWTQKVGISPEHIVKMDRDTNFWEHGKGPCGPSSEIYFDRGEKYGCGSKDCGVGCECDRYVEIWNLVFTQFNNEGNGKYTKLSHPNIDTGMGLERLACIMQGVDNLFEIDSVKKITEKISEISGAKYGENDKNDISLRIITDHIRSTTFMIADGITPSNEGRGYVLRRLLRRASRHGKLLGIDHAFLSTVCDTVIDENKDSYVELSEKRDYIKKLISVEEENFSRTIDQGLQILGALMQQMEEDDIEILSGEHAFKLNDTYGFPIDLTKEIIAEKGLSVDEDEFRRLLSEQRTRARNARKKMGEDDWTKKSIGIEKIEPTKFIGYDKLKETVKIISLIKDNETIRKAEKDNQILIITDKTPFYAESGGQVGDTGFMETTSGRVMITDTVKDRSGHYIHEGTVVYGEISCKDEVLAVVDKYRRMDIMRNHTGAHLLQAGLKKVLGNHVEQAGQYVSEDMIRFDFTHFSAMTEEEIRKVETIINGEILKSIPVKTEEMPIEEAKSKGAMALFGEKYGDIVRVVSVYDGFSMELCGGTHISNTAQIGLFKIISESSISSGVRRIEAVTGISTMNYLNEQIDIINESAKALKLKNKKELPEHCKNLINDLKNKEKSIDKLNRKIANAKINSITDNCFTLKGFKVVVEKLQNVDSKTFKNMCDTLRDQHKDLIAVLTNDNEGKVVVAVSIGKNAVDKGINAGKIAKHIAEHTGGNGGGRKDFAMAGIKDKSKLDEALEKINEII